MTAGTKIFLLIVAVLVAVLVVYYGVLMRDDAPPLVMDEPEEPVVAVREVPRPSMASPRAEPRAERPRILGTPREEPKIGLELDPEPEPARDSVEQAEPQREVFDGVAPLADHLPVTVTDRPVEDGGKDAPDATLGEAATDGEDADLATPVAVDNDEDEINEDAAPEQDQLPLLAPEPPQYTEYTVRSGDTMSSIAAEWFGEAGKWDLIAKANPFVDPNRLTVGQVLRLPPKDAEREEIEGLAGNRATVYVVRSGDNLSKIARAYYNDEGLWRLIYDANRATIGNDPARLRVGMRLTIPPAPKPAQDDDDD